MNYQDNTGNHFYIYLVFSYNYLNSEPRQLFHNNIEKFTLQHKDIVTLKLKIFFTSESFIIISIMKLENYQVVRLETIQ